MGESQSKSSKDDNKQRHNDQRGKHNSRTTYTPQTTQASKYKHWKKRDLINALENKERECQNAEVRHTERLREEKLKHQDTTKRFKETSAELQKRTEECRRLQGNVRATEEKLSRKLGEQENLLSQKRDEIRCLEKKNAYLLTRLSAFASAKLTDGNANIADLSDGNRPTKLGEQFSELYDNEWTDAYAHLTTDNKRTEEEACKVLLNILCVTYTKCKDLSIQEMNNLMNAYKAFSAGQEPPSEILKMLKDIRKTKPKDLKETNIELNLRKLLPEEKDRINVKVFFEKCLSLCWLMVVQDPPVYIDTERIIVNESFDSNIFKPYTKSGSFVDFIVWPALYLCKGGGILTKGVAQCKANQKPVSPRKDNPKNSISSLGKQVLHVLDEKRNMDMGGARAAGLISDNCTEVSKHSTNEPDEKIPKKSAYGSERKTEQHEDSSTRGQHEENSNRIQHEKSSTRFQHEEYSTRIQHDVSSSRGQHEENSTRIQYEESSTRGRHYCLIQNHGEFSDIYDGKRKTMTSINIVKAPSSNYKV